MAQRGHRLTDMDRRTPDLQRLPRTRHYETLKPRGEGLLVGERGPEKANRPHTPTERPIFCLLAPRKAAQRAPKEGLSVGLRGRLGFSGPRSPTESPSPRGFSVL